MNRVVTLACFFGLVAGCQIPPERAPVKPLAEDSAPLAYAELLTRARLQASSATEAFYINRWGDLEDTARGLEQTARFLAKATEVPANHKGKLTSESEELEKLAQGLREAAKGQNVTQTNEVMRKINLKVRELRLED